MAGATIAPSLPSMAKVFASYPRAELLTQLILTVPALAIVLVAPFVGRIIDKTGRLRLLLVSVVLYAAAGTSGLYLDDLYLILAGRILLGFAVGGIATTVITLAGDYWQGQERQGFLGIQGAFMALGGVIFVGSGGLLADLHWRAPFWIYALSLLGIPLIMYVLKEPERVQNQAERKEGGRVNGVIWFVFATIFMVMLLFYMVPVQIPFFLKYLHLEKSALAGAAIVCLTLTGAIAGLIYRKFSSIFSFQQIYAFGFLLSAVGYTVASQATDFLLIGVGMSLSGFGMGVFMPNTSSWILSLAPEHLRGRYMGINTTCIFLGQFFSPILIGPFIQWYSFPTAFLGAAALMAGISAVYFAFHFWQKRQIATSA